MPVPEPVLFHGRRITRGDKKQFPPETVWLWHWQQCVSGCLRAEGELPETKYYDPPQGDTLRVPCPDETAENIPKIADGDDNKTARLSTEAEYDSDSDNSTSECSHSGISTGRELATAGSECDNFVKSVAENVRKLVEQMSTAGESDSDTQSSISVSRKCSNSTASSASSVNPIDRRHKIGAECASARAQQFTAMEGFNHEARTLVQQMVANQECRDAQLQSPASTVFGVIEAI
ncbi:hypothetical protein FN846DRAFT_891525 [Sphaerosporella brunnea]|uniref:Uncharacterized protein n=1 Tax=Sphaerosporella brunnea TaxID=1250544 RepID=A0A5J5ET72_9PEZI|nr:hypothetical protein FN846DRAFT_891525 [Sphaerosporella brunnea]